MLYQAFILLVALILYLNTKDTGRIALDIKLKRRFLFIIMLLFAAQSGLRHIGVGADTFNYYTMFQETKVSSWNVVLSDFSSFNSVKDPGYSFLVKLFSSVFPSFRLFLIAVAVFFFYSLGYILDKYTSSREEILVSIALYQCLFYSFFSITGTRQTIATAFLLLSIPFALEKKPLKFFLLVLLASSQHRSAFLFSIFFFLPYIKASRLFMVISSLLFFVMATVGAKLLSGLINDTIFDQYANYLEKSDYEGAKIFIVFLWLMILTLFFRGKYILKGNNVNYVFINTISTALLLSPLTTLNPSNMRIVQYFSICCLIVLPKLCTSFKSNNRNKIIALFVFFVLSVYTLFRNNDYSFFWQKMDLDNLDYINGIF